MRTKFTVFLTVALLAAPALGADKVLTPREMCDKFIETVKAGKYREAARDKVLEMWAAEQKAKAISPNLIDEALCVLVHNYNRSVLMIQADRLAEASAILDKLAKKPDSKFMAAAVEYQGARILVKERNWEAVVEKVKKLRGSGEFANFILQKRKVEVMTARAFSRVALIDEAIEIAKKLTDTEEGRKLLARLEVERDGATLDDVADSMDDVKKRLDQTETGLKTRSKQDRIIAMLDMLIELAQEQEQGQGQGQGQGEGEGEGEGEGQGQGQGQGKGSGSGPPSGTGTPSSPATESALVGGASNDEGKAASTATMRDFWAKLPTKERAKVLDALRKRFPRRYRQLVEAYYKSLATEGRDR